MQELTKMQEMLIDMMNLQELSSRTITIILLALKQEEQQKEMMDYLIANKPSEQQVLQKLEDMIVAC